MILIHFLVGVPHLTMKQVSDCSSSCCCCCHCCLWLLFLLSAADAGLRPLAVTGGSGGPSTESVDQRGSKEIKEHIQCE